MRPPENIFSILVCENYKIQILVRDSIYIVNTMLNWILSIRLTKPNFYLFVKLYKVKIQLKFSVSENSYNLCSWLFPMHFFNHQKFKTKKCLTILTFVVYAIATRGHISPVENLL